MEVEDRQKIERFLENIICSEAKLVSHKNAKLQADENFIRDKEMIENSIKISYREIAIVKRKAFLRQKGAEWSPADYTLCEAESEKDFQRWKDFTPGEKIKQHRERIGNLENEPMTNIQVDRWIEKEFEKELESLEKAHEESQRNYEEKIRSLREKLK